MMNRIRPIMRGILTFTACLVVAAQVYAQRLETGDVEVTGQVGVVTGIGTHASVAGSGGKAINDKVFAFGELGWIPTGSASISNNGPGGGLSFDTSGHILTFMGGAQYQFGERRSLAPYAGGALGLVHIAQSATQTVGGNTSSFSATANNFYVSFGGGARYSVNERWGFKPEFMIFVGDNTFFRFGGGIFYIFKK